MASSTIKNPNPSRHWDNRINIMGYNSIDNLFTAPNDGYILLQVWDFNISSESLWIWQNALKIQLTTERSQFAIYAAKGTTWWIEGSGDRRSAFFYPIVK